MRLQHHSEITKSNKSLHQENSSLRLSEAMFSNIAMNRYYLCKDRVEVKGCSGCEHKDCPMSA